MDILSESKSYGTHYSPTPIENLSLAGGATTTILNYSGDPGYLTNWQIAIAGPTYQCREFSRIKIYVDGETSPSVDVTLGQMHATIFCAGYYNGFSTRWIGVQSDKNQVIAYSWRFPIAFSSALKIDIVNGDATHALNLWASVQLQTGVANSWDYGKLRAACLDLVTGGNVFSPYALATLVDTTGANKAGRLLGMFLGFSHPNSFGLLEGNPKIYADGNLIYQASGIEDYFQNAGYFSGGIQLSDHVATTYKVPYVVNAHRFHVIDPIKWAQSLKITVPMGDSSQATFSGNTTLCSTVWWYE